MEENSPAQAPKLPTVEEPKGKSKKTTYLVMLLVVSIILNLALGYLYVTKDTNSDTNFNQQQNEAVDLGQEIKEEQDDPVENVATEDELNEEEITAENTELQEFKNNNIFKSVEFSGMSFMLPENWQVTNTGDEDYKSIRVDVPDGNEISMWETDGSLPGSGLYTECRNYTDIGAINYDNCESGLLFDGFNYLLASTVLDEETAAFYPEYSAASVRKDLVIFGNDYLQVIYRQKPNMPDVSIALDYMLETLTIE